MKHLCLFAASVLAGFAQTPPPPPQGSIEGHIGNANTGAPLRKVTVRLVGLPPQDGPVNGGPPTPPRTMSRDTDEHGHFQFTGLDAGRYQLSATRQGFLQQSYGARRPGYGGTPILLSQDQHVTDVSLRLTPQGVITGRVLDEDGDPIPNVSVKLMRLLYRNGAKQWTQSGGSQSSDIGEYRLPNLEPGRYLVAAGPRQPIATTEPPPDKPETIYAETYYPRSLDVPSASPVEIGAGTEVRGIDIHLVKTPSVRIRGTVANASEGARGRGSVQVGLLPRDGGTAGRVVAAARIGDNRFELRGVQPGSYLLYARSGAPATGELFASQALEVGSAAIDGLALTLSPAMDIAGQVTVAESDAQIDLKSIVVRMRPSATGLGGAAPVARMEAGGQFTVAGVMAVRYAVAVTGIPDGCFVQSMKYSGQEIPSEGVEFTVKAPLEVVLSATAGKIAGTVTDKNGRAVLRAIVALIPADPSQISSATSDDTGSFTFDRLRPGRYKLIAWEDTEPGAYQDPEFRKPYESRATEINVGPRDQQTAQLRAIAVEEMTGVK